MTDRAIVTALTRLAERLVTVSRYPEALRRRSERLTRLVNATEARIRMLDTQGRAFPQVRSANGEQMLACVRQRNPPWSSLEPAACATPGMITPEESRYYTYIGRFYSGLGEVVELGPWLGRSTFYILQGLAKNPRFSARTLRVYDDFVWRAHWMDPFVKPEERVRHHGDFEPLFDKYTEGIRDRIRVQRRKIVTCDGNDDVEQLGWDDGPIEIMYVDCGRTFEANEAWWTLFVDSFIPNRTLIVLEDWNTHREVPVRWYNQIKQWVDSKGAAIQLVHELEHGGIASFLFTGRS